MYELIQAAPRTYYIQCPAKMGLWRLTDTDVVLIDSGNDKDAGRKVQKILDAQGWHLACILNTHANADHNGGNALLQQRLGAPAYAPHRRRRHHVSDPGARLSLRRLSPKPLRNKFLLSQPSRCETLTEETLPEGLTQLALPGHFFDMCGFGIGRTGCGSWRTACPGPTSWRSTT